MGSISSMFYVQLLPSKNPKALKDTDDLTVFLMLSGSTSVKAACKMLVKLTPGGVSRFVEADFCHEVVVDVVVAVVVEVVVDVGGGGVGAEPLAVIGKVALTSPTRFIARSPFKNLNIDHGYRNH